MYFVDDNDKHLWNRKPILQSVFIPCIMYLISMCAPVYSASYMIFGGVISVLHLIYALVIKLSKLDRLKYGIFATTTMNLFTLFTLIISFRIAGNTLLIGILIFGSAVIAGYLGIRKGRLMIYATDRVKKPRIGVDIHVKSLVGGLIVFILINISMMIFGKCIDISSYITAIVLWTISIGIIYTIQRGIHNVILLHTKSKEQYRNEVINQ